MKNYYSDKLNAIQLQQCYEIAPQRVKQFLEAEIDFVLQNVGIKDKVLDLGCGYGRVTERLIKKARKVVGIDISESNIQLAKEMHKDTGIQYFTMNAIGLSFIDNSFDMTICIQNGISAFKVDPKQLIKEALRVTKKAGKLLFSSYSEKFWDERLNWFKIQADHGLIGEIDYELTKNGVIICKDGFKAITFSSQEFLKLTSNFNVEVKIHEIDNSSLFCEMIKK